MMSFIDSFNKQLVSYDGKKVSREKYKKAVLNINLKNAKELGTDLVEATFDLSCCSECAKYRGRVFSISGKDKRFPKLPVDYGCACPGISFYPFLYGVSSPTYCPKNVDIIKYSNRPFVDERTKKEKEDYNSWVSQQEEQIKKEKDKAEYEKLLSVLPSITPKSFASYRRMKKANTDSFKDIVQQASKAGVRIELNN